MPSCPRVAAPCWRTPCSVARSERATADDGTARLRVTHVIDSLGGSGGAENRLVDEVLALDRPVRPERGPPVRARLPRRARSPTPGVPVVALGFQADSAGRTWPAAAVRLARALRADRPDVIHTSLFTGNLVGQLAGALLGIPVVSTFNRTGELALQRQLQAGRGLVEGPHDAGRRPAGRPAAATSTTGPWATTSATPTAPLCGCPRPRTVVPAGRSIDPASVAAATRGPFGVPDGVPLFANVARLVPEKAQHLLVEAFARVRAELPDAHLAIAGDPGPALAAVQRRRSIAPARGTRCRCSASGPTPGHSWQRPTCSRSARCPRARRVRSSRRWSWAPPSSPSASRRCVELTEGVEHAWLAEPGTPTIWPPRCWRPGRRPTGRNGRRPPSSGRGRPTRSTSWPGASATCSRPACGAPGAAGAAAPAAGAPSGTPVPLDARRLRHLDRHRVRLGRDAPARRDRGRHNWAAEREVVDRLLALFARYDISATWALVGHLFLDRCHDGDGQALTPSW